MGRFTENHGVENTYPKARVANTSIPEIKRREMDQSNIPQEFSSSQADKDLKYLYQKIEELERERAKYERDLDTLTEQAGNLSDSDGTDEEEQEGEDEEKAGNKKKDNISDANKTQSEYYEFHVKYPDKKYDFKSDSSSESNSKMIKETHKNLAKYIDDKYRDGEIVTSVSNVTKGCVKVTFRVLIRDKSEIKGEDIKAHIESGLKAGFIGPDAVIEEGFTFIHLIESDLEKEIAKMKAQNLELKKKKEKLERRLKRSKRNKDGNSRKQEDVKPIKECDIRDKDGDIGHHLQGLMKGLMKELIIKTHNETSIPDVSRLQNIELMMEKIQKQNQLIIKMMSAKKQEQTTTPVESLDPPLSSEEDLRILENKLTDGAFMEKMVRNLKTVEVDDVKKHTKAILSRLMTKDLASKYTWTGTIDKKPFKDLLVNKLIQMAVRRNSNHCETTDEQIKDYTTQWLKNPTPVRGKHKHSTQCLTGSSIKKPKPSPSPPPPLPTNTSYSATPTNTSYNINFSAFDILK